MKKCLLFLICLLAFGVANCSLLNFDNEVTQYIVIKEGGNKLRPVAKIEYKVFIDRQEIVYRAEIPGQGRSELYKLRKCIIFDKDNWEGEPEISNFLFLDKVKFHNGKFQDANSVSWWTWHFDTDPKPNYVSKIISTGVEIGIGMMCFFVIIFVFILIHGELTEKKKVELNEKAVAKDIAKLTRTQREEFKKSGNIK
jgi:hypothetical protein